jgi:hypothetical protein
MKYSDLKGPSGGKMMLGEDPAVQEYTHKALASVYLPKQMEIKKQLVAAISPAGLESARALDMEMAAIGDTPTYEASLQQARSIMEGVYADAIESELYESLAQKNAQEAEVLFKMEPPAMSDTDTALQMMDGGVVAPSGDAAVIERGRHMNWAQDWKEINEAIESATRMNGLDDAGISGKVFDALAFLAPLVENKQTAKAIGEMLEKRSGLADFMLMGEAKRDLANAFAKLPQKEKIDFIHKFGAVMAESSAFIGDDNQLRAGMWFDQIIRGNYSDFDQGVDNVIAGVDFLTLGVAGAAVRLVNKVRAAGRLRYMMGENGTNVVRRAETNSVRATGERSSVDEEVVGVTGRAGELSLYENMPKRGDDELVLTAMSKVDDTPLQQAAPSSRAMVADISDEIMAASEGALKNKYQKAAAKLGHLIYNQTRIMENTEDSFTLRGMYSADTDGNGWINVGDVVERFEAMGGAKNDALKVWIKEPDGTLSDITTVIKSAAAPGGGRFTLGGGRSMVITEDAKYLWNTKLAGGLGPDHVLSATRTGFLRNSLIGDAFSRFKEWFARTATVAVDRANLIERNIINNAERAYKEVPRAQRQRLQEALEHADMVGQTENRALDLAEIEAKLGVSVESDTGRVLFNAYKTFQEAQFVMWKAQNTKLYTDMAEAGYRSVVNSSGKYVRSLIGRKAAAPKKDDVVGIVQADGSLVKAKGGTIDPEQGEFIRIEKPHKFSEEEVADVVFIPTGSGHKTTALQKNPLKYQPGHFQKMYKDKYFVDVIFKNRKLNGKKLVREGKPIPREAIETRAVAAVRSGGESYAEVIKQEYAARGIEVDVRVRPENAGVDLKPHLGYDGTSSPYSLLDRTEGLTQVENGVAIDKSNLEDPYSALLSQARDVSRGLSVDKWIDGIRSRMVRTYGITDPDTNTLPVSRAEFIKAAKNRLENGEKMPNGQPFTHKEYNEALSTYDYLLTVAGKTDAMDSSFRNLVTNFTDVLDRNGWTSLATALNRAPNWLTAPVRGARIGPSAFMIAMNPVRQLFLQPSQLVQAAAIDPTYAPILMKDLPAAMAILRAVASGGGKLADASLDGKAMASLAHMVSRETKFDELVETVEAFYNSTGLAQTVDKTVGVEGTLRANHIRPDAKHWATGAAFDALSWVPKQGRKFGFDAGEMINMLGHFMASKNYWKKNLAKGRKWSERESIEEIQAFARNVSGNMNDAGRLAIQGSPTSKLGSALSIPLQFAAFPLKNLQVMLTNAGVPAAVKRRLIMSQALMWGTYGVPFGVGLSAFIWNQVDPNGELDPQVKSVIDRGLGDFVLNQMLKAGWEVATGQEQDRDFNIASSMGAASWYGDFSSEAIKALSEDRDVLKFFTGAAGTLAGKFGDSARALAMLFETMPASEMNEARWEMVGRSIANISSGSSNAWKAYLAFKYDMLHSSRGDKISETSTDLEAFLQIIGIQPAEVTAYYTTLNDVREVKAAAKEEGARIGAYLSEYTRDMSYTQALQEYAKYFQMYSAVIDNPVLEQIFMKSVWKEASKDNFTLAERIEQLFVNNFGAGGSELDAAFNAMAGTKIHEKHQRYHRLIREGLNGPSGPR